MKKLISLAAASALLLCILSGCSGSGVRTSGGGRLSIVCTIFPEYDWLRQLTKGAEDGTELTLLISSGVDLHSYQPTADDIIKISSCDMFVYVGGESDAWVADALKEAVNRDMTVVNLMDILREDNPGRDFSDEHIWLSLENAGILCSRIAERLEALDPDNAGTYAANAEEYAGKLRSLDEEYKKAAADSLFDTVVFGDRFPFCYLMDDCGVECYAAFEGCSAENEASFETVASLADKVDELGLKAVLTIDGSNGEIARTIVENSENKDQKILMMDSMQSVTAEDIENGAEYLSVMERNLDVLKEALN